MNKHVKKIISTALAAMVLFTSTAFAYTDVPDTDPDVEAISILTTLGILEGFEDGSFRPDDTITRAEAAKIMVLALRGEPDPYDRTPFIDVPGDPEGWINAAYANRIIDGCGDGRYRPDEPVTYEEAVKMMVVALGYTPAAVLYGGYPSGHFKCAEELGILEGISITDGKPAITRRQLARLLYNSLEVDMMDVIYTSGGPWYSPREGYTLLNILINKPKWDDVTYPLPIKGVSASYMSESLNYPGLVADGNKKTDWTCWGESNISVDLGDIKDIGLIKLFVREYDDNRSLTLTLEISEDGENWIPVGTETYGGGKGYSSSTELDAQARYVRVNCNGTSVNDWVSLAEIEIYRK